MVGAATARKAPLAGAAPKRISILGATGSIGASTLAVIGARPGDFAVEAVTANANVLKLARVARSVGAKAAIIADASAYGALKEALSGSGIEAAAGPQAVIEAATRPVDLVVAAIVGAAGLAPSYAALAAGTPLALANKECLVSAGDLFMRMARARKVTILPVDSEHNAIFQILDGRGAESVERIVITASGGPFRDWTRAQMATATPSAALAHPTWVMGPKITIDSATLMNKGLELVEAHHLFGVAGPDLDVLIHPQSIVHGLVTFRDGSVLASLAPADMRGPIAYCLNWPERVENRHARLDLAQLPPLAFLTPDEARFPALAVARQALDRGTQATNIMSAANEVAVEAFLGGRIGFLKIAEIVEETLERASAHLSEAPLASIEDAIALDKHGRRLALEVLA
jgi:1-deoxy-D-xylulose-5-phosphate reductoisomerase